MTSSGGAALGEGGEPAQVAEHHGHVAPVAFEERVGLRSRRDEIGDLRRQEALQPADPLDLRDLLRRRAPRASCSSRGELCGLLLDLVVQRLDPQHRAHPRDERRLVEGLGEIVVGAGVEPCDDIGSDRPWR